MYKHILIATDGSELAQKAEMTALTLAKALRAQVTAVTVTEPWETFSMVAPSNAIAEYEETVAAAAKRILGGVLEMAKKVGVACDTVHIKDKHPAEGIIESSKARGCDLIVMASHGRRGIRMMLGSQVMQVLPLSAVPILVSR